MELPGPVKVTVGAITVTAQATSSPDRHDTQGSGDFYLAISGNLPLATTGDLHMATDTRLHHRPVVLRDLNPQYTRNWGPNRLRHGNGSHCP
jgi:hypothetical protein